MKRLTLAAVIAMTLAFSAPAFAQHSHPSPGGPAGRGPDSNSGMSGSHATPSGTNTDMSHRTTSDVLSHNTAIAGKIKAPDVL